jgi:hypothetical protein
VIQGRFSELNTFVVTPAATEASSLACRYHNLLL